jgi:hypothetical protein
MLRVFYDIKAGFIWCRYPTDWIPPYISFKSIQWAGHVSTRCHVPYSSGPHLPVDVGSDAITCPATPYLTFLSRWALILPRVPRSRTSPHCRGGLRRCHVFRGPEPHLLAEMSSGVATCPSAPDLASLLRWVPMLTSVPWLQVLPPRGESSGIVTSLMTPVGCGPQE